MSSLRFACSVWVEMFQCSVDTSERFIRQRAVGLGIVPDESLQIVLLSLQRCTAIRHVGVQRANVHWDFGSSSPHLLHDELLHRYNATVRHSFMSSVSWMPCSACAACQNAGNALKTALWCLVGADGSCETSLCWCLSTSQMRLIGALKSLSEML